MAVIFAALSPDFRVYRARVDALSKRQESPFAIKVENPMWPRWSNELCHFTNVRHGVSRRENNARILVAIPGDDKHLQKFGKRFEIKVSKQAIENVPRDTKSTKKCFKKKKVKPNFKFHILE